MGQIALHRLPRLFTNPNRRNQTTSHSNLCTSPTLVLQHPALSYAAEELSIHDSLDLSFRRTIAVSRLDRELIDNLNRLESACGF